MMGESPTSFSSSASSSFIWDLVNSIWSSSWRSWKDSGALGCPTEDLASSFSRSASARVNRLPPPERIAFSTESTLAFARASALPHLLRTAEADLPKSSAKKPWNSGNTTSSMACARRLQSPTMCEREVRDLASDLKSSDSDFERLRLVGFPARSHKARASASIASFFTFLTLVALRQLDVSSGLTSKTS